jgi:hypothetical protein
LLGAVGDVDTFDYKIDRRPDIIEFVHSIKIIDEIRILG